MNEKRFIGCRADLKVGDEYYFGEDFIGEHAGTFLYHVKRSENLVRNTVASESMCYICELHSDSRIVKNVYSLKEAKRILKLREL